MGHTKLYEPLRRSRTRDRGAMNIGEEQARFRALAENTAVELRRRGEKLSQEYVDRVVTAYTAFLRKELEID